MPPRAARGRVGAHAADQALARNNGFTARELRMISRMIDENRIMILEAWHEHCG